ncbi:hypothetical protein ACF0H5_014343 [Mactra antiquata]
MSAVEKGENHDRSSINPTLPSNSVFQNTASKPPDPGGQRLGPGPTSPLTQVQQPGGGVGLNYQSPVDVKPLSFGWSAAIAAAQGAATMTRRQRQNRKHPNVNVRPPSALFCLGLKNPIRKLCIQVVEWKYPLLKLFD